MRNQQILFKNYSKNQMKEWNRFKFKKIHKQNIYKINYKRHMIYFNKITNNLKK